MGVVLLFAYRASYFLFMQHKTMPKLYIISFKEYPPEVLVSYVICHYQILQIDHLSMYSQDHPHTPGDLFCQ